MRKIINTFIFLGLFILFACDNENPIDKEQYFKQVYIVGASDIVSPFDVPFSDNETQAYISIATGGSHNINKDVLVKLTSNDKMIDWYNNKYMIDNFVQYIKLDESAYTIPSYETTIKKGDIYSRLPFSISTENLSCDSLYALTFAIESVSEYQKNEEDTVLIMNINLINDFSGVYHMTATRFNINEFEEEVSPVTLNASRTVKAVNSTSVRFINEAVNDTEAGYLTRDAYFKSIEENGVVFEHIGDNKFTVKAWGSLDVIDGYAIYQFNELNAVSTFLFSFDYKKGNTQYRLKGTFQK